MCVYVTGSTEIEIHFLEIKLTAIGVYLEPSIVEHLQQWKGKAAKDLEEDDDFFQAIISGISLIILFNCVPLCEELDHLFKHISFLDDNVSYLSCSYTTHHVCQGLLRSI